MEKVAKVQWDDSYLLNIPEIDAQHKRLLAIANELYDAATGSPEDYKLKMSKVLKALTDYTVYHFTEEEKFMAKYGYPATSTHKVAHDAFVREVEIQIRRLDGGTQDDALKLYSFIVNWVLMHIARADRIWGKFVSQKLEQE